jgi:preprotein translocase subunit YajC
MHLRFSLVSLIAQEDDGSSGGSTIQLIILLMIPLAMYFLLFRPQRKRVKEAAEMQKSLGVGDEVVLTSGIYGFITGEEGSMFWVEIDDDVQVRVAKAAVQGKVNTAAAGSATDEASPDKSTDKSIDKSTDKSTDKGLDKKSDKKSDPT